jgi:glycosyltransferase involved in cell wall biosynthesis
LKILFLVHEFPPCGGGAGRTAFHLAEELRNAGQEIVVLTCRYRNYHPESLPGIRIHTVWGSRKNETENRIIPTFLSFLVLGFIKGILIVRKEQISLVHACMSVPAGILAWIISLGSGVPYIVSLLGSDVPHHTRNRVVILLKPLIRRSWKRAARVIAQSQGTRLTASLTYPGAVESFGVIYSGVNRRFRRIAERESRPPQPRGIVRIVTLGRLIPLKGVQDVLDALALLKAAEKIGEFVFTVIGTGPKLGELKIQADRKGIGSFVRFRGFIGTEEIVTEFNNSDFFILTSYSESMGMVFVEALACGLPLIGSNVGGIPEIIDADVGLLVESGNVPAIADAILEMSRSCHSYDKEKLAVRASQFSWKNISGSYLKVYTQVAGISTENPYAAIHG